MTPLVSLARRRPGLSVFVCALVLRLGWVLTLEDTLAWPDEREFAAVAEHLAAGDGYVSNSYRANPVLPVYLSIFVRAFGSHWLWPRIGQALIGAASCVLLFRLTGLLAGPLCAALAGLMLTLYPGHIYLAGVFYVDCLATFLLLLSVHLTVRAADAERPIGWAVLAGVTTGLTALTRATFIVLIPALALALFQAAPGPRRRPSTGATALTLAALLTIVPWAVRNSREFGRPMLISSGLWETFWKGNNEVADGGPDDRNMVWGTPLWESRLARLASSERPAIATKYERVAAQIAARYPDTGDIYLARDEVLGPVVRELIAADPVRFLRLCALKLVTLFEAFSDTKLDNADTGQAKRWVAALTFYPVLLLAILGAVLTLPLHRRFAPVSLSLLSVVGLYAALTACTRFRLTLDPLLMVFAAVATEHALLLAARRARGLAAPIPAVSAGS